MHPSCSSHQYAGAAGKPVLRQSTAWLKRRPLVARHAAPLDQSGPVSDLTGRKHWQRRAAAHLRCACLHNSRTLHSSPPFSNIIRPYFLSLCDPPPSLRLSTSLRLQSLMEQEREGRATRPASSHSAHPPPRPLATILRVRLSDIHLRALNSADSHPSALLCCRGSSPYRRLLVLCPRQG